MVINFDEKSDKCNFAYCRNYVNGECHNEDDRKQCLELAFAVLGVDDGRKDFTSKRNNRETGDV